MITVFFHLFLGFQLTNHIFGRKNTGNCKQSETSWSKTITLLYSPISLNFFGIKTCEFGWGLSKTADIWKFIELLNCRDSLVRISALQVTFWSLKLCYWGLKISCKSQGRFALWHWQWEPCCRWSSKTKDYPNNCYLREAVLEFNCTLFSWSWSWKYQQRSQSRKANKESMRSLRLFCRRFFPLSRKVSRACWGCWMLRLFAPDSKSLCLG